LFEDFQHEVVPFTHVHQRDLVVHQLLLSLIFEVLNELESDDFTVTFALHLEHFRKATRTQLVLRGNVVMDRGVLLFEDSEGCHISRERLR
jgi:hypothetical protein